MVRFTLKDLISDYRSLFFFLSFLIYGSFSSPTPDSPSWAEFSIFLFLALSFGGYASKIFISYQRPWQWAGLALLVYGLSIPTIMGGAINNNMPLVIVRDVIGFIFLTLPLFMFPFLQANEKRNDILLWGALFIGLAFSLRVLFVDFSFTTSRQNLLYLANSPLVLFSALYFTLSAYSLLIKRYSLAHIGRAGLYGFIALLPLLAMFIDFQRASFIAVFFALTTMMITNFYRKPIRVILSFFILLLIAVIGYELGQTIINSLITKTAQVGLNMRLQELTAVWEQISVSPFTLLLGHGWGAEFESPAVGNLPVAYTHSLISYMLLKTGLIGLCLTFIYMALIFEKLISLVLNKDTEFNALLWPFIIPILFYASYKSFDYGLLLTLVLVTTYRTKKKNKSECCE